MMNNLFSIFDPSSSTLNLSWMSIMFPILFIFSSKFIKKMTWLNTIKLINSNINKEMKSLLSNKIKKGSTLVIKSIFTTIIVMNFLALFPFIFTPTAHISISFTTALIMWVSIMLFGWTNNSKNMVIHMVPVGTPTPLMNFMVIIELVSNLIRPITLSVRLTANMVAGHLLMSLLSNFALMSSSTFISSTIPMFILTILELAVAFIQAYVFITLITLYHNEIF